MPLFIYSDTVYDLDPFYLPRHAGCFRIYMFVPVPGEYATKISLLRATLEAVEAGKGIPAFGFEPRYEGGVWFQFNVTEKDLEKPRQQEIAVADLETRIQRLREGIESGY
ncbi:hypothetical protein P168DRAFT_292262 [Aspergillus campestris IBT 28561]|uniref:Uncharacterized protein n=1 Tax=Aspergillus campestris (strain IBT 28561) TaxID=1392248 RepID=A0A2I1CX36_ASPC2|nr:uncharacterized protein P168DRAFT_292262 [Aspergillus campestris IBT 28561]PKY02169.1 hypothetical protein P168DRAFT_292262 [Aspergillus campestris IBT 28561]